MLSMLPLILPPASTSSSPVESAQVQGYDRARAGRSLHGCGARARGWLGLQLQRMRATQADAGEVQKAHPEGSPSVTPPVRRIRPLLAATQHMLVELSERPEWPGRAMP